MPALDREVVVGYRRAGSWLRLNGRIACRIVWAAVRHPGKAGEIQVRGDGRIAYFSDSRYACACCGRSMTYREVRGQMDAPGAGRVLFRCVQCVADGVFPPRMRSYPL
jgi:hypothetical protein